ncbi:maleylacetate reductase [Thioclava sp. DLFJ4-1]|uniref:maleylacetate reductase n=1 Tax=Thioclava sp. DLFJ4-1 TaxID=1915313 RepID=UPI00099745ED|nr:maleylacetate reductase [Thioclava sp. DLFJ4-1]OOY15712.1 maleylacetate reductase [Thioclava sp. DLFJ4-1]
MPEAFIYTSTPGRIVFGSGTLAKVAEEVERLGCARALILSTPFQKSDAEALANKLGEMAPGTFTEAAMHTPVAVTEAALEVYNETKADCVVALGGGSTIGLGKAIAWRNDAPQVVIATTYAGSEVTDILGQTENGQKTTVRDPKIRPETVIYDPDLTLGLPVAMSVASGLNAMAHAVEALYAPDANPVTSLMAVEGLRALKSALPRIVETPEDRDARADALYGSWLCGTVLGAVAMSLHHKLCHTLGGGFDMPHAETHAILLPHTAAYNAEAASAQLARATELFGGDLGGGLHDFARSVGAPLALADFDLRESDLARAADMAVQNPYKNPRDVTRDGILDLLTRAHAGQRPVTT